jgi:hypothetical protein
MQLRNIRKCCEVCEAFVLQPSL